MRSCFPATLVFGVFCLLLPTARAEPYGWAISASSTDPFQQTGPALGEPGVTSLWLWLVCDHVGGIAAAEFDLVTTGDLQAFNFAAPYPTWINVGTAATSLMLVAGGCPTTPLLAGEIVLVDLGHGGTVCLAPSAPNGLNATVDCSYPQPRVFANSVLGFSSDGSPPCVVGTCSDPTGVGQMEASSWGRVKGIYR
jgi:hypothetical protein